jgi:flagellar biosynthetic protein FliR
MTLFQALARVASAAGLSSDLTTLLLLFSLTFVRLVAAISFSPFMGGNAVPGRIKVGIAVIVAAVLYPNISTLATIDSVQTVYIVALILKEILIGMVIGYVSQMVFYSIQMAGTVIDTQRGMNQATFVAPQLPGNVSILGQVKFQASIALFLSMNGHLMYLRGLDDSFRRLPIAQFPRFQAGMQGMVDQIIRISANVVVVGLQLAAPVLIALFLIDISFGAIGKVAPQINVHSESQPVKSLIGLAVFLLALGLVFTRLEYHFAVMLRAVEQIVRSFA